MPWRYHRGQQNNHSLCWPSVRMEHNMDCYTVGEVCETASLLISHPMSTVTEKRIAVRVTSTRESPYLIKNNTQIAEFSVVNPEQSKHIKPVDMAVFSKNPQGDPDLTAYLKELLRRIKPEQQNNTFWFLTPENPRKPVVHSPILTRTFKTSIELEEKKKRNPQGSTDYQNKFLKRFHRTNTFLTELEKQAIEDILAHYHDLLARHRKDIEMNTEFKMRLTPQDEKTVFSQSLPKPIPLKEDLFVEIALIDNYGIITVLHFSEYANPIFAQREPTAEDYVFW